MNSSIQQKENRHTGSYYTPRHVAEEIVNAAIGRWIQDHHKQSIDNIDSISEPIRDDIRNSLSTLKILDPSVGNGVFLLVAGEYLETLLTKLGDTRKSRIIRANIVRQNLYGIDIQSSAVQDCKESLSKWICENNQEEPDIQIQHVFHGNTLIGKIRNDESQDFNNLELEFNWYREIPEIFREERYGFDIIIGNPPYGNLLKFQEKEYIKRTLSYDVMSGKMGSWNTAPIFIVRSRDLLHRSGQLALLVPNSILRVGQFRRIREFINEKLGIWKIIDEGNPFDGVTLEMISIFCSAKPPIKKSTISVTSKRAGVEGTNTIPRSVMDHRILSIYHDSLFSSIRERGKCNLITASRGRDIPSKYTSNEPSKEFQIPYATRGRSVRRYKIDDEYLKYTNDWFMQDDAMLESYSSSFIVATKNYPYPRCVQKQKGIVHGGGIVRIIPLIENLNMQAVGLILNSRLVRYISTKYLTNYAQLTTCLNTGIIEEIPLILPEDMKPLSKLFETLQELHSEGYKNEAIQAWEEYVDAMIYSIYLEEASSFSEPLLDISETLVNKRLDKALQVISEEEVQSAIDGTMSVPIVKNIESSPRMK